MPKGEKEPEGNMALGLEKALPAGRGTLRGSSPPTWPEHSQNRAAPWALAANPPRPLCARMSACIQPGALPACPYSLLSACPRSQYGSDVSNSVLAPASCSLSRLHFVLRFCQMDTVSFSMLSLLGLSALPLPPSS